MRPRVPWMNEVDDAVLEFFDDQDSGVALPPTPVWYNLVRVLGSVDRSQDTVARRMRMLESVGLLDKIGGGRGYYYLTAKGRDYLSGDLDPGELGSPDD